MTATCRTCNAPIIWAVTVNGKRIPLDATPTPRGNLVLEGGTARTINTLGPDEDHPFLAYTSHFSTCPDADSWRKR